MAAGLKGPLVVDAFVEEHTQGPPVDFARVSLAFVHFGGQVGERARLARQRLVGREVGGDVLGMLVTAGTWVGSSIQSLRDGRGPRNPRARCLA